MIKSMKDFQLPTKLDLEKETASSTYGKFIAEPFERGFGTTMGNAIRRVLLSSLPGAAVTSVKIEGVYHEFSTIPGVTEDVTILILNIKGLRIRLHSDKAKAIRLKKKGPGEVKAGDFSVDADVTILNPDLHIATLDKDGLLDMELIVKPGRGYVPAERNKEFGLKSAKEEAKDQEEESKYLPSDGNDSNSEDEQSTDTETSSEVEPVNL